MARSCSEYMFLPCSSMSDLGILTSQIPAKASTHASSIARSKSYSYFAVMLSKIFALASAMEVEPGKIFSAKASVSFGNSRPKSSLTVTVNFAFTFRTYSCGQSPGNTISNDFLSPTSIPTIFSSKPGSLMLPPSVSSWNAFCCIPCNAAPSVPSSLTRTASISTTAASPETRPRSVTTRKVD